MNKHKAKLAIGGSIAAIFILVFWMMSISYSNKEITLREQIATQQEVLKDFHTVVWKVLQEKANITDKYKGDFQEVYSSIMQERYSGKEGQGNLFSFVMESNPQFDVTLYHDLATTVEAKRTEYFNEQKKLRDLKMQHDLLLERFPGSLFVGGREKVQIQTLSSDKTEQTFQTGKDNEVLEFK